MIGDRAGAPVSPLRAEPTGPVAFAAFVEELYLAYLERHSAWGGPARIPQTLRAWVPPPTAASITFAAARAFQARVEAAACATTLERKRGGITYATEVRRLHDALVAALPRAPGPATTSAFAGEFVLRRVGSRFEVDLVDPASFARATTAATAEPAAGASACVRTPSRRDTLRSAALLPVLLARTGPIPAGTADGAGSGDLVGAATAPVARVAAALRDLDRLPWRDRYPLRPAPEGVGLVPYDRDRSVEARLRELDAGPFVTAGALARRLAATLTAAAGASARRACARDVAHADRATHARFDASTADLLLARLRPFAALGTHWAGPYAGDGWSWDSLVSCAMFDLRNFAAALRGREDCIAAADDPLTFESEVQIALDPFLFRYCTYGSRLIGRTLCARATAGLDAPNGSASIAPSAGAVTYVWLLDEAPEDEPSRP